MKQLFDLETYPNFFCIALEDLDTCEKLFFEISEERDDRELIYKWFSTYSGFLIHFNGMVMCPPFQQFKGNKLSKNGKLVK